MSVKRRSNLVNISRMVDRTVSREKPKVKREYKMYRVSLSETGGNLYICRAYFDQVAERLGHEPSWFRRSKGTKAYVGSEINLFRYVGKEDNALVLGVSDFEIGGISEIDPRRRRSLDFLTYSLRKSDLNRLESTASSCIPTEAVLLRDLKQEYDIIWI